MLQKDVGVGGRILAVLLAAPVLVILLLALLAVAAREWGPFSTLWLIALLVVGGATGWAIRDLKEPGQSPQHWVAVGVVVLLGLLFMAPMLTGAVRTGNWDRFVSPVFSGALGGAIGGAMRRAKRLREAKAAQGQPDATSPTPADQAAAYPATAEVRGGD